jgi:hypothetical protein
MLLVFNKEMVLTREIAAKEMHNHANCNSAFNSRGER